MTTIKATNGQWVNLSNHLPKVLQLEGKTFATAVAVNTGILRNSLTHLEGILNPSPEFAELSQKANAYQNKTDKISLAAIKKLEKDYADAIQVRKDQVENVNKLLSENLELEVEGITEEMYPESITAEQILGLDILKI